jgi:hypothetical protein
MRVPNVTVFIDVIRRKTPAEVREAVDSFAERYVEDWEAWLAATPERRPILFGQILRKWQATRPLAMRRTKGEAVHEPPFLEDLLGAARGPLSRLGDLTLDTIRARTPSQEKALVRLWEIFRGLTTTEHARAVGITKAILLLTDGRIGPAFDSQVREQLGVRSPATSGEWIE